MKTFIVTFKVKEREVGRVPVRTPSMHSAMYMASNIFAKTKPSLDGVYDSVTLVTVEEQK